MDWASVTEIAAAVARGESALSVAEAAFKRIRTRDKVLNAFTATLENRALEKAQAIDTARSKGNALGPLAGVPFAVKNLFRCEGHSDRRRLQDQPQSCGGLARRDLDRTA